MSPDPNTDLRRDPSLPRDERFDALTAALVADAERQRRPVPADLVGRIQARIAVEPRRAPTPTPVLFGTAAAAVLAIGIALWPGEAPAIDRGRGAPFAELASVEQAVQQLPKRLTENLAEPLNREAEGWAAAGSSAARRLRIRGPLRALVPFLGSR